MPEDSQSERGVIGLSNTTTDEVRRVRKKQPGTNGDSDVARVVVPQHRLKIVSTTVASLRSYGKNPRKGNVSAIVESLKQNGQYRPIVVQKKTRTVLAGNHTLLAAKALGWKTIDVVYVDVDDEEAKRIVLADNRTNDLATYDYEVLGEILASLPSVAGTGYSDADVAVLTAAVKIDTQTSKAQIEQIIHPELDDDDTEVPENIFAGTTVMEEHEEDPFLDELDKARTELPGVIQLSEEFPWRGKTVTSWEIPVIGEDNLVQPGDLPENIMCYVPRMHRDWPDNEQGWLIIGRTGNTAGLKQPATSIMSFYTHDEYFESWWFEMAEKTTQMLNVGIKMAVSPNYSLLLADQPKIESLWAIYRSRYITRYWQEVGIKVIPDLMYVQDDVFWNTYFMSTLPKRAPVVALQRQFHNERMVKTTLTNYHRQLRTYYERLKPEVCVVYASDDGAELVRQANLGWDIIQIELFPTVMRDYKLATKLRGDATERVALRSAVPKRRPGRLKKSIKTSALPG